MSKLDTFPVSIKIAGKRIVIVGGGADALNKTRLALRTSARVEVWARSFDPGFEDLPAQQLTHNQRVRGLNPLTVGPHWLAGAALVFVADTGDDGAFAEQEARAARIPVNVVDQPGACDFYTPAIVDRAPVSVAVMTEGAAPVIGRRVRAAVEAALSPDLGKLVALCGSLRGEVSERLSDSAARRRFYERLADSPEIAVALAEGDDAARERVRDLLGKAALGVETGSIAWIGGGPGAEDLLTLRAQRLLQGADVIVADADVPTAIIDMGRRDAERIVLDTGEGARTGNATRLVELAEKGRRVVRLVAGDAATSSHAVREIASVRQAGIFTTLVPGVALTDPGRGRRDDVQRVA